MVFDDLSSVDNTDAQHTTSPDEQIMRIFRNWDIGRKGYLSHSDLTHALQRYSLPPSFALDIMIAADADWDGRLNWNEFYQYCKNKDTLMVHTYFREFSNSSMGLSPKQLQYGFRRMNIRCQDDDVKHVLITTGVIPPSSSSQWKHSRITYDQFRPFSTLVQLAPHPQSHLQAQHQQQQDTLMMASQDEIVASDVGSWALAETRCGQITTIAVAAAASGFARTCVAPIERLRLQMIVDGASRFNGSVRDCYREIWNKEGFRGLFRGNSINTLRIAPQGAVTFFTQDYYRDLVISTYEKWGGSSRHIISPTVAMWAGVVGSGITATTLIYPLDLIRGRLTTTPDIYKGVWHGLRSVWRKDGFRGLFRGLSAANAWVLPYSTIQFACYSAFKEQYTQWYGKDAEVGPTLGILVGGITGMICTTAAFPLELVRRKLQVQGFAARPTKFTGIMDCINKTVTKHGWMGLFSGLSVNLIKIPLSVAIVCGLYETVISSSTEKRLTPFPTHIPKHSLHHHHLFHHATSPSEFALGTSMTSSIPDPSPPSITSHVPLPPLTPGPVSISDRQGDLIMEKWREMRYHRRNQIQSNNNEM